MSHQYICEYNSVILYGQCVGPGELRAAVMSIERLQKAANAAGYAMAAPDDDADDSATYVRPQATGTAVAVVTAETRAATASFRIASASAASESYRASSRSFCNSSTATSLP